MQFLFLFRLTWLLLKTWISVIIMWMRISIIRYLDIRITLRILIFINKFNLKLKTIILNINNFVAPLMISLLISLYWIVIKRRLILILQLSLFQFLLVRLQTNMWKSVIQYHIKCVNINVLHIFIIHTFCILFLNESGILN